MLVQRYVRHQREFWGTEYVSLCCLAALPQTLTLFGPLKHHAADARAKGRDISLREVTCKSWSFQ